MGDEGKKEPLQKESPESGLPEAASDTAASDTAGSGQVGSEGNGFAQAASLPANPESALPTGQQAETQTTPAKPDLPEENLPENISQAYRKLLAEKDELYDRLLRQQAESENFRKRVAREKAEFFQFAGEKLVRDLLPLLDGFERALAQKNDKIPEEYYRGTELLYRELWDVLSRAGLSAVEAKGETFDPHLHQAVETIESTEHEDHAVIEEHQKGYKFKQRLLRPSLVKVALQPQAPSSGKEESENKSKEAGGTEKKEE